MMSLLLPVASLLALLAVPSYGLNYTAGVSPHHSLAVTIHGGLELAGEDFCVIHDSDLIQWEQIMGKDARTIMKEVATPPKNLTFKLDGAWPDSLRSH
ncbi:unnamed protein product [Vitrella brassicaformis CCMP3155]|uniref:Uncharacterized protein n=1 Tax=Vitrella brassicaformis (strain CCMP3155) TaxID=1169540 RepID=A0A0G4FYP3_VITBC|nr:unnamed protein product [Vitrella brassicaformis CCMP3155]|mmetsp:Transcript_16290/g.39000  ORF Transcript_16290/g.39000 Transcript_16290/m.39000 type:complete len:98 (-) Transcript_16290:219-512(-)|eukprot:CEM20502.1 unnamed protein product [Vitrella brassicaformis CCMP3155]